MATMASHEFTRASSYDKYSNRLAEWWNVMRDLRTDSSDENWDKWASYLSPDCTLHLSGMGHHESHGPSDAVEHMKKIMTHWELKERRVLNEGMDFSSGRTVMASMNNRLSILGQEIEFPETEVVEFDEQGRIVDYKLYCDPKPIMELMQQKSRYV